MAVWICVLANNYSGLHASVYLTFLPRLELDPEESPVEWQVWRIPADGT